MKNPNCNGDKCTRETSETRRMPAPFGASLVLCQACYAAECEARNDFNSTADDLSKVQIPEYSELDIVSADQALYRRLLSEICRASGAAVLGHGGGCPVEEYETAVIRIASVAPAVVARGVEKAFEKAVRRWAVGNNSGNPVTLERCLCECDTWRAVAEQVLVLFGAETDYPGLYPTFRIEGKTVYFGSLTVALRDLFDTKKSEALVAKHSAFGSFQELLDAKGGYKPSLDMSNPECRQLATRYDLAQIVRGDSRRAYRYGAPTCTH